MFSTQQLGQYVSGMICRGNTSASNRSYYKAEFYAPQVEKVMQSFRFN